MTMLMFSRRTLSLTGLLIAGTFLVMAACSKQETETVVVSEQPHAATSDTSQSPTAAEQASADFEQLTIGEIHPINTLDPLFANSPSARRLVQLLYEGLVRLNASGNITPAVAKSWEVSSDSLTYTFHLRGNVYYHDSDVFNNGIGRKLTAGDIKNTLERMCRIEVPPAAARTFWSIKGLEGYFKEQHYVYNQQERELEGINGITIPNDSTVTFMLDQKDPRFVEKLASPYAVIVPPEAVNGNGMALKDVGSGPFRLSQHLADTLYTLTDFGNYWMNGNGPSSIPYLDRVDIVTSSNEKSLFKQLQSGDIQVIPEPGPVMSEGLIDSTGSLLAGYRNRYTLQKPGGWISYKVLYNDHSTLTRDQAETLVQLVDTDQLGSRINPTIQLTEFIERHATPSRQDIPSTVNFTYSTDPYVRLLVSAFTRALRPQQIGVQMVKIRVPTREIPFTVERSAITDTMTTATANNTMLQMDIPRYVITKPGVQQLQWNDYPWWIDLRTVRMPASTASQ